MNDWEILGINQTLDISEIKKAYAQQLKLHHPEDDPKGFQSLREAYGRALGYAEYLQKHPIKEKAINEDVSTNTDNLIDDEKMTESALDDIEIATTPPEFINFLKLNYGTEEFIPMEEEKLRSINEFYQKIEALYSDFFKRIDISNWELLFADELLWQLDSKELISTRILNFLKDNYYLPREVWKFLNKIFFWEEFEDYLPYYYPEAFVKYLFFQLGDNRIPRYCYFDRSKEINFDEYLGFRESAFLALQEFDLEIAAELISKASDICSWDPDLYCLKGELYYRESEFEKAKAEFRIIFKTYPKDAYLRYYKADIFFTLRLYDFAFQECYSAIRRKLDLQEIHRLAGKCKYQLKSWEEAADIFVDTVKKYPDDIISRRYLVLVKNIYINQLREIQLLKYPRIALSKRKMLKRVLYTLDEIPYYHEFRVTLLLMIKCFIINIAIIIVVGIYSIFAILSLGLPILGIPLLIVAIKKEMNKKKRIKRNE